MKKNKYVGFAYHLSIKKIRAYQKMPLEKRLAWLYQGNLLRKAYPRRIIELQNKFREGKI
ncbi:MAG: hypothetical protein NC898_05715 [Candidatus Omnitrophica bacterium]|nr:hypothetical protein [Candidatus Omnitrophota bacterium]MCM8793939.1 hypothetical protein [Candidatus Omnitrophota bacterium]